MFRTILFATDGSALAERVLLYVEHLARQERARVIVLHAYDPLPQYRVTERYQALADQLLAVAEEIVDDAVQQLRKAGVEAVPDVREGPAPAAILEAARAYDVDLIVMGTRGLRNVNEVILGSVSHHVLRHAPCPVLVVP